MKATYQKLYRNNNPAQWVHVLVLNGEVQADKKGFVTPMRPYQNMTKIKLDFVEKEFSQPRTV